MFGKATSPEKETKGKPERTLWQTLWLTMNCNLAAQANGCNKLPRGRSMISKGNNERKKRASCCLVLRQTEAMSALLLEVHCSVHTCTWAWFNWASSRGGKNNPSKMGFSPESWVDLTSPLKTALLLLHRGSKSCAISRGWERFTAVAGTHKQQTCQHCLRWCLCTISTYPNITRDWWMMYT